VAARSNIVRNTGSAPCRYYQGLTVLQQHFPIGRKREGISIEFPWYDAFQSTKKAASDSITYEKASILFNLAAVCSQQSLASDLSTDGGLKAAARHFQVRQVMPLPQLVRDVKS